MAEVFAPGSILRIEDYPFQDGGKPMDKYAIIVQVDSNNSNIIHCLTTSQVRWNQVATQIGCHKSNENLFKYYFYPALTEVGQDGFSFNLDTYINFRANVRSFTFEELQEITKKHHFGTKIDVLVDYELKRLRKCIRQSNFIPRKYLHLFEDN